VLAGTNWFFISIRSQLKQCSYSISEADPSSTYMRCMQWPPISASMIIGPSVPSSSPRDGKRIYGLGEKLCVILCLATISQGWTIRMANALSFLEFSLFFAALGCSFPLFSIGCSSCHYTPGGLRWARTHLGLVELVLFLFLPYFARRTWAS
nr:hypothetical protein [Tanacetum cinerariifolium]